MDARRRFLSIALGGGLLLAAATAAAQEGLRAPRVAVDTAQLVNPDAGFWDHAPELSVPLLPQNITTPQNPKPAVSALAVRVLHNTHSYAFRIEWADPTKSDRIVLDTFGDQVAVQLPVKYRREAPPSPMMGNPGGRVNILQWRAAFQRDLEQGEPQVRDLYPFAQVDVYPDQVLRATDARPYMGAVGVDNPISHPVQSPVLDQMAEGWGTMTAKPEQHPRGKGVWHDGRWRVTIVHPLATESDNDPSLRPGDETVAAFAVWEGGAREVGARKAWSGWVPVRFE